MDRRTDEVRRCGHGQVMAGGTTEQVAEQQAPAVPLDDPRSHCSPAATLTYPSPRRDGWQRRAPAPEAMMQVAVSVVPPVSHPSPGPTIPSPQTTAQTALEQL